MNVSVEVVSSGDGAEREEQVVDQADTAARPNVQLPKRNQRYSRIAAQLARMAYRALVACLGGQLAVEVLQPFRLRLLGELLSWPSGKTSLTCPAWTRSLIPSLASRNTCTFISDSGRPFLRLAR